MITKQDEGFNFKFVKNYDVEDIENYIKDFSAEWYYDTTRQEMYEHHKFTNSYFLYEHSNEWVNGDPYKTKLVCEDKRFMKLVSPIISDLEEIYNGRVGKALFINLVAGKKVEGHYDSGDYLGMARRTHIPIITNPDVDFIIEDETINMKTGECWEINNNRFHAVNNRSKNDRVHLLIDILPDSFFK